MSIDRRVIRTASARLSTALAGLRALPPSAVNNETTGLPGNLLRVPDVYAGGLMYVDTDDGTTSTYLNIPSEARVATLMAPNTAAIATNTASLTGLSRIIPVATRTGVDATAKIRSAQQAAGTSGGVVLHDGSVGTDNWSMNAPRAAEFIYGDPLSLATYATDHRGGRSVVGGRLFQNTALQAGDNGYLAYLQRLETVVQGRSVSTVTSYIGMNSLATGTGLATEANRTNMVALTTNAAASTTTASAGVESFNAIAYSAYTGPDYQPVIGIESDVGSARDAGYFGVANKSYSIGYSAIWTTNNNGTAAYSIGTSNSSKGWLHGMYIAAAVDSGFTVFGKIVKPKYGGIIASAAQAALIIGPRKIIDGTIGANSQDVGDWTQVPPVGVIHDVKAAGASQDSIPARWTAMNASSVEVNWDVYATPFTLKIMKNGAGNIAFTDTAMLVGANQVVAARRTGWTLTTGALSRATFDTATVTTQQLAQAFAALQQDMFAHGLIGA
jgi:hypothetical protein